jgi:hypothetical protein
VLGPEVLHKKALGIKLNRAIVISSKLANKDEVFDDVGRNKNIVEVEWTDMCRVGGHNGKWQSRPPQLLWKVWN